MHHNLDSFGSLHHLTIYFVLCNDFSLLVSFDKSLFYPSNSDSILVRSGEYATHYSLLPLPLNIRLIKIIVKHNKEYGVSILLNFTAVHVKEYMYGVSIFCFIKIRLIFSNILSILLLSIH